MSKTPELLPRSKFREAVFARDGYTCVLCGFSVEKEAALSSHILQAHHIVERRLFQAPHEKGGYFVENGSTVCEPCHLLCEQTVISCEEVRDACSIKRIVLPEHLYADQPYTKWGDPILGSGQRIRGELFNDKSVQKVLRQGKVLDRYTDLIRFPRTYHLPWSPGMNSDDKMMASLDHLAGEEVVITTKWDGRNTTIYPDGRLHARSPDGRPHHSQAMVKTEASRFAFNIPEGWRVCGEDLYAKHSIAYDALPSFFLGFQIWNERNICLSWDETTEWFELLEINPVDVLWRGTFDEKAIRSLPLPDEANWEGYVVRLAGSFAYAEYPRAVGKYVRANHNKLGVVHNWRSAEVIPNKLAV